MYARIVTFEADESQMQQAVEMIRQDSESGPPEGLPSSEFMLLTGKDSGKMLGIVFFDSEEDMRKGDEVLNAMNPSSDMGSRTGVEMFEVALHMKD